MQRIRKRRSKINTQIFKEKNTIDRRVGDKQRGERVNKRGIRTLEKHIFTLRRIEKKEIRRKPGGNT